MLVKLDKIGIVESGRYQSWQIRVEPDRDSGQGFFVLISRDFNNPQAEVLDTWVETFDELNALIRDDFYQIAWR